MTTGSFEKRAMEVLSGALDVSSPEREAWVRAQCAGDETLSKRVLSLLAADQVSNNVLMTGGAGVALAEPKTPERVGAYRITKPIGQGGMGAVYEGCRDANDFEHRVAIKVIKPGVLSETLVERFRHERQILATLSHPNIARLYDGGETEDGAPFIVMEFVDGQPVTEWSDSRNLPLNDRLWLFTDICGAVRHAHQNLIVHRDITPSNVLVTEEGIVKLIDFGIAKPQDVESVASPISSGPNSLASLSFTPGYAAPERVRGAPSNTLSDIYSLGKLLQALIREFDPGAELCAIIQQATEDDPSLRYASVDALLDDIYDYREGRSVSAYHGGNWYKFTKFARRRKYAIAACAIVFSALAGGLLLTTQLYNQAESARATAASRFTETRELTRFLLTDLDQELENVPGGLEARRKLTETSARYLDLLAEAADNDPDVRLEYAIGLGQLGKVLTAAGGANLGDPNNGLDYLAKSLKILNEMQASSPQNTSILLTLADVESDYGYALMYHAGDNEGGALHIGSALNNYDRFLEIQPDNVDALTQQAATQLVNLYLADESDKGVPARLDEMERHWESIRERFPDNDRVNPHYASFLRIAANLDLDSWSESLGETVPASERERYEKALQRIRHSVELAETMLKAAPVNQEHIYQFVWSEEIEALLMTLDVEWEPDFEKAIEVLAPFGHRGGSAAVNRAMQDSDIFAPRLLRADKIAERLDESDRLLNRIAPYDGETFTYKEAVYYNMKARAYALAQLSMDLDGSETWLDAALNLTDELLLSDPASRQWQLEKISTLTEKAYLLMARGTLFGEPVSDRVCGLVEQSSRNWQAINEADVSTEGYDSYRQWNEELARLAACHT